MQETFERVGMVDRALLLDAEQGLIAWRAAGEGLPGWVEPGDVVYSVAVGLEDLDGGETVVYLEPSAGVLFGSPVELSRTSRLLGEIMAVYDAERGGYRALGGGLIGCPA